MSHGEMSCPNDGAKLVMSDRQGVEIDYCPTCRGVWLDRGELDKIIERSNAQSGGATRSADPAATGYAPQPGFGGGYQPGYHHPHHKRKKSFLEEIFD